VLQKSSFTKFDALDKKKEAIVKKTESVSSVGGGSEEKICRCCGKVVFLVELVKAEKATWHKNCFRCVNCNKQLTYDYTHNIIIIRIFIELHESLSMKRIMIKVISLCYLSLC